MNNINKRCLVTTWFPDKGYGFVALDGQRVFIHASAICHAPRRGTDITGQTLVVSATVFGPKGLSVSRAVTLEEHEKEEGWRTLETRRKETDHREIAAQRSRFLLDEGR